MTKIIDLKKSDQSFINQLADSLKGNENSEELKSKILDLTTNPQKLQEYINFSKDMEAREKALQEKIRILEEKANIEEEIPENPQDFFCSNGIANME